MRDICCLDTAVCEESKRRQLLECLGFGVVLKGFDENEMVPNVSSLNWMILRRLDVLNLDCYYISYIQLRAHHDFPKGHHIPVLNHNHIIGIVDCCPSLMNLDITDSNLQDESVCAVVANCQNLKYINIDSCDQLSSASLIALGNLGLIYLIASNCKKLFVDVELSKLSGCFKSLKSLSMNNGSDAYATLLAIVQNCSLKSLTCESFEDLSDEELITVAENCRDLERLHLSGCAVITDASIVRIAKICCQLRLLDCSRTHITEAALIAVAKNCRQIESIYIGCRLTDSTIELFADFSFELQDLGFEIGSNFSEQALIRLFQNCPKLSVHCRGITLLNSCYCGYKELSMLLLSRGADPRQNNCHVSLL